MNVAGALAHLGRVEIGLHAQPHIRAPADSLFEPDRHFGREIALAGNDAVQLLPCSAQRYRGFGHTPGTMFVPPPVPNTTSFPLTLDLRQR